MHAGGSQIHPGLKNILLFTSRIHGLNERISVEGYEKQVEFLFQLIQNCDTEKLPEPHASSHEL